MARLGAARHGARRGSSAAAGPVWGAGGSNCGWVRERCAGGGVTQQKPPAQRGTNGTCRIEPTYLVTLARKP